jgi:hypothetical protein
MGNIGFVSSGSLESLFYSKKLMESHNKVSLHYVHRDKEDKLLLMSLYKFSHFVIVVFRKILSRFVDFTHISVYSLFSSVLAEFYILQQIILTDTNLIF